MSGKFYPDADLNQDAERIRTPAEVDEKTGKWFMSTKPAMEYYGPTESQRPSPGSVPVGAVYMAVNTGEFWQSNGTEWVVF